MIATILASISTAGFFTDSVATRHHYLPWLNATVARINHRKSLCMQIVDVHEHHDAAYIVCNAINSDIKAIIAIASCSSVEQLVPRAIEASLPLFVVDRQYCITIPIKSDNFR